MTIGDDDLAGMEIDLSDEFVSVAEVVSDLQEGFPELNLSDFYFIHADEGKIIIARRETPTKPN